MLARTELVLPVFARMAMRLVADLRRSMLEISRSACARPLR